MVGVADTCSLVLVLDQGMHCWFKNHVYAGTIMLTNIHVHGDKCVISTLTPVEWLMFSQLQMFLVIITDYNLIAVYFERLCLLNFSLQAYKLQHIPKFRML